MTKLTKAFYPHHVRALAKELSSTRYDGMATERAFEICRAESKRLAALLVEPTDEEQSQFPTGVPGMRNAISRELFDAAWSAARGA